MRGSGFRPSSADLADLEEGRRLLDAFGSPPSEATMAQYRAAVERMRRRALRPEQMAGTKRSYYFLRAALLAHAADRLRGALPGLEASSSSRDADPEAWDAGMRVLRAALELARRYPPGDRDSFMEEGGRCAWSPAMTDPAIRARSRSTDVESTQAALPAGWMSVFWDVVVGSGTKYASAIAVELSVGCRRKELRKGVRVATDGRRMKVMVRGCKTDRGHGRRLRVVEFAEPIHPWHRYLLENAVRQGRRFGKVHVLDVSIRTESTYTGVFAHLADKAGFWRPSVWEAARGESKHVRDALAVVMATGWTARKVAAGVVVEAIGEGVAIRPRYGRARGAVVDRLAEPWELHLGELATRATGGVAVDGGAALEGRLAALKAASPVGSVTPYVGRHAVSAMAKAETRLPPSAAVSMSPEERAACEARRRDEVARVLGHASPKTQSGYGRAGAAKGSSGITAARGACSRPTAGTRGLARKPRR